MRSAVKQRHLDKACQEIDPQLEPDQQESRRLFTGEKFLRRMTGTFVQCRSRWRRCRQYLLQHLLKATFGDLAFSHRTNFSDNDLAGKLHHFSDSYNFHRSTPTTSSRTYPPNHGYRQAANQACQGHPYVAGADSRMKLEEQRQGSLTVGNRRSRPHRLSRWCHPGARRVHGRHHSFHHPQRQGCVPAYSVSRIVDSAHLTRRNRPSPRERHPLLARV